MSKKSGRLDIIDMPRDTTRCLGTLRRELCKVFNYCRNYPLKMKVLKEVLKYTYNRIVVWEKAELKRQADAEAAQAAVEQAAAVATEAAKAE